MNEIVLSADLVKTEELAQLVIDMNDALVEGTQLADEFAITDEAIRELDYKELKHFEQELSAAYNETEEARKAFNRAWDAPKKQIEAKYKECVEVLKERHQQFKEERVRRDNEGKVQRREYLEAVYADFCEANGVPQLVENIPFERILDQRWLNKSVLERTAELELVDKVADIIDGWNVLGRLYKDKDEAARVYFDTLSIKETDRVMAQLEEERAAAAVANIELAETKTYGEELKTYEVKLSIVVDELQMERLFAFLEVNGIHGTKNVKEVQ